MGPGGERVEKDLTEAAASARAGAQDMARDALAQTQQKASELKDKVTK